MNDKYFNIYGIFILIITAFLLGYYGYWYLQIVPAILIGYFMVRKISYIILAGVASMLGIFIALIPSYATRIRGASLASSIAGIPFYLVILLTFLIIFVITIAGLLIGSSINK